MRRTAAVALLMALMLTMFARPASADSPVEQVISVARDQLGKPYALFSDAPRSFNCVSFVAYCFNQVADGTISLDGISGDYKKIKSTKHLKTGDILCFKSATRKKGVLSHHYGIYLGKGYFIHASNADKCVTISKLKSYKKRFTGAVRIL